MRPVLAAVLLLSACAGPEPANTEPTPQCSTTVLHPKRQLRGAWIASVQNIDWPSRTGLPAEQQQAEFRQLADRAQRLGLNALFVQVRPTADAFFASQLEPWSQYLMGQQGADPGYDPLKFIVEESHARNLELHAWFNPYRVSMQADPMQLAATHPGRQHMDWLRVYGGKLYYDPGNPDVRNFIEQVILDVVARYDIDGVHFDDYFYPYPVTGATFYDDDTYAAHGAGFPDKDQWRRHNVDLLVQELNTQIHAAKPWVRFGISPFGIWRNSTSDPTGSATRGLESYAATYSDTRNWIKNHWVDYVVPQVYWNIGYPAAAYDVLVPWWAHEVEGTGVELFIGEATYRIGGAGQVAGWQDPQQMVQHLEIDAQYPEVRGQVFFSLTNLIRNPLGSTDRLLAGPYRKPALVPDTQKVWGHAPGYVNVERAQRTAEGIELSWTDEIGEQATAYYAIYRVPGTGPLEGCHLTSGDNLLGTVRRDGGTKHSFVDRTIERDATYTYVISALDRLHQEGVPSLPQTVRP